MKRSMVAMILSAAMIAGIVNPALVHAAETAVQETSAEQDVTGTQSEETEAEQEIEAEQDEVTKQSEEAEQSEETEQTEETEQSEEAEQAKESEQVEETEQAEEADQAEIIYEAEIDATEEVVYPGDSDDTDPEELFTDYVDRSFNGDPITAGKKDKTNAFSSLSGYDLAVYNYVGEQCCQIAAGELASTIMEITPEIMGMEQTSWTAEELGVDSIWVLDESGNIVKDENGKGKLNPVAVTNVRAKAAINTSKIIDALLADYPYDLYWYQKKSGTQTVSFGFTTAYDKTTKTYSLKIRSNMVLKFSVIDDYAVSQYEIDTAVGQTIQTSVENAKSIVEQYSDASDVEKLRGYKNEICDLVSYNYRAISSGASYGNPWQMIWVFDGDPDTKVVCEGYSKAFKYLCDQTEFEGDIGCILASGSMVDGSGAAGHMWNVVKMEDGKNYLVDVTNCDSSSGASDRLFLVGTQEEQTDDDGFLGYYFETVNLTYYYDGETEGIFREEDLKLCGHNYGEHTWDTEYTVDLEPTCTAEGSESIHCSICGAIDETTISSIPMTAHVWEEEYTVDREPTCTKEGSESVHCSACGTINETTVREIAKKPHEYGEWEITVEPTCTSEGSKERACIHCGDKETGTVDMLPHTWEEEYTIDLKPTRYETGLKSIHCAVCDTIDESTIQTVPVLTGQWKKNSTGWWYLWEDGSYSANTFETIGGVVYRFNASGYMVTGWQYVSGKWYYFNSSGAMLRGWQRISGTWYYFDGNGVMQTGWQKLDGKTYYFNYSGAMLTGWQYVSGKWYYFNSSGAMLTGWQRISGAWYYFNGNGVMLTGWQNLDNKWYYFNGSGVMQTGWKSLSGKWYYFSGSGAMLTGWQKISGSWYYFNDSGAMLTGWIKLNETWYYLNSSGVMLTGWQKIGGTWYYFNSSGAMQ